MDTALKFDSLEVNVDLAKEYIIEYEDDIKNRTSQQINGDAVGLPIHKKNKILTQKITENSKLICELEYLSYNTPIEDTEKNIQLILKYLSISKKYRPYFSIESISVLKDTPLMYLMYAEARVISACDERHAICHLWCKLCAESGFDVKFYTTLEVTELTWPTLVGAVGVVAERSDLDSAVDAFLMSSSHPACLWRLNRIFVQESIFQLFKKLIEHKAELKRTCATGFEDLKSQCADLFVYEKKVILFDYAGDGKTEQFKDAHAIHVEAYRTNKELLSLVGGIGNISCVSLWSSDVAEANEIAFKVPASLVWINDYGNFDGPSEIGNFFSYHINKGVNLQVPKSLLNRYETWKTYDTKKRVAIISDVLERVVDNEASKAQEGTQKFEILELQELIYNLNFSSVDVADGKICVTVDSPVGLTYGTLPIGLDIIRSLVAGNGVILNGSECLLYKKMSRAGVPLWDKHGEKELTNGIVHCINYRTKVVLTNFGTIFSN